MLDLDTFLTTWYVQVDDAINAAPPRPLRPGSRPSLSESEVATLAMAAQWKQFPSERAFVRSALRHLRLAFLGLPDRSQFNRLIRKAHDSLVTVMLRWAQQVGRAQGPTMCWRSRRGGAQQPSDCAGLAGRHCRHWLVESPGIGRWGASRSPWPTSSTGKRLSLTRHIWKQTAMYNMSGRRFNTAQGSASSYLPGMFYDCHEHQHSRYPA